MPVTNLTDSLPWWAGQGGPQGGPGAAPMGGGAASAPAGGQPPGSSSQDWLAYLSQMFGISPAQAEQLMTAQQGAGVTADNPHGDGPPPPPMQNFGNFQPQPGPGPGNVGPVPLMASMQRSATLPPDQFQTGGPEWAAAFSPGPPPRAAPRPAPVATSTQPYGGPMAAADAAHAPTGGAYSHMPFPGQRDPQGFWGPQPSAGPLAAGGPVSAANFGGGGAAGSNATSNPRFANIDRPNMAAEGGGQARGGPPQMSALNLAGLFNRGQQAGPLAAKRRINT